MFSTRINPAILKELKHLSIDAETPISDLAEEGIRDLLKQYEKRAINRDVKTIPRMPFV